MDEKALYKLTYGLYIVSAQAEDEKSGCVVNTVVQVTSKPMRLSVAVNKDNYTCGIIEKAGHFSAVALDQRADLMYIGRFGFRTGREMDKFEDIETATDKAGAPYPTANACAHLGCKVIEKLDLGTHMLFIGECDEAELLSEDEPLTYSYYRNVIKGLTPKNAPSYIEK